MLRSCAVFVTTVTLATARLFAQDECPAGNVLDQNGKPVAGAQVGIRWLRGHADGGFHIAIEQLIREAPLPKARTDQDGRYTLVLSREQLLLGTGDGEAFAFVVESPGFQRWVEPLPHGVRSFLGSEVRLVPLRESDLLRFQVIDPEPGMWLLVRRSIRAYTAHFDLDPGELVPVPADGRVVVRYPLVPSPAIVPQLTRWCAIALDAQVLFPGRSCDGISVDPDRENLVTPRPRLPAGEPRGAAWSARYRAPNGAELTFELTAPEPPPDSELRFLGRTDTAPRPQPRDPLVGDRAPGDQLLVTVFDEDDKPIQGALVLLGSVLDDPDALLGSARFRTDARGRIEFKNLPDGRYCLVAGASHFETVRRNVALGSEVSIVLQALAQHPVRVIARDGGPLAFRWFLARNRNGTQSFVRTDGAGRLPLVPIDQICVGDWVSCVTGTASLLTVADGPHFVTRVPLDTIVLDARHTIGNIPLPIAPRTSLARGNLALLSLPLPDPADTARYHFIDGSILRIQGTDGAWLAERGARLVPLDARFPEARVTLAVRSPKGPIRSGVLVTPGLAAIGRTGRPLAEPNADGTWSIRVRSTQPLRCWVTHEDHVPEEIVIPPLGADVKHLEVTLTPGIPFSWRKLSPRLDSTNRHVEFARLTLGGKQLEFAVECATREAQAIPPVKEDGILERAPFALPRGNHIVFGISEWSDKGPREVSAEPATPAVLDMR